MFFIHVLIKWGYLDTKIVVASKASLRKSFRGFGNPALAQKIGEI